MKEFYAFCRNCRSFSSQEGVLFRLCAQCLSTDLVSSGRVCLVCGHHEPKGSKVRYCPYHRVPLVDIQQEGRKHFE